MVIGADDESKNPLPDAAFTEEQIQRQDNRTLLQNSATPGLTDSKIKRVSADVNERRQRIFEEEIIKRVKEIQRYAKTIHLQVKKS